MSYNSKAFGIVIGRLRTEKGLTQERMSGLAGIARSHLAALENGEKTARLSTLWNIAYALDIRLSELIRLTEEETEKHGG
ncbi:MAG: helix-turn-helix transcriptional regulator [Clostridia bacterium]|nr:helix-turn-helix transcriptional regulator [Clostridia bacterium]